MISIANKKRISKCAFGHMNTQFIHMVQAMKKTKHLAKFANWLEAKAEKNRDRIMKFGFFGLILFVGTPLPGTGAWTGSLAGSVLRIPFWRSLLATFLGVLMAGTIMTIISYTTKTIIVG